MVWVAMVGIFIQLWINFAIGSADTWKELGSGIVNIGYKDPTMSVKTLFIALVFAGPGGTANLAEVWGGPGRTIFLLVGVATLFSTQLALVDGVSRSISDIVPTSKARGNER